MTGGKGLKMQWGFVKSNDKNVMDWDKVFKTRPDAKKQPSRKSIIKS